MGVLTKAEVLAVQAKSMPEPLLQEVLDFMGYLRMKHGLPEMDEWDMKIQADAESGALDAAFGDLADEAISEHRAGRTTPL